MLRLENCTEQSKEQDEGRRKSMRQEWVICTDSTEWWHKLQCGKGNYSWFRVALGVIGPNRELFHYGAKTFLVTRYVCWVWNCSNPYIRNLIRKGRWKWSRWDLVPIQNGREAQHKARNKQNLSYDISDEGVTCVHVKEESLWPEEWNVELRNRFRTEKPFSMVTQIYDPASSRAVIRLRNLDRRAVHLAEALEEAHRTAPACETRKTLEVQGEPSASTGNKS